MLKALYTALTGAIGAVAVHLLIIFQLPAFAGGQVTALVQSLSKDGKPILLDQQALASAGVRGADPLFKTVACPYDLSAGAFVIKAAIAPQFWTLGVMNGRDEAVFSITQRLAVDGAVDVLVLPERDRGRLEAVGALQDIGNTIVVFSGDDRGHVALRLFTPDASWQRIVNDYAATVACATLDEPL